uniref:Uncharacterized protein n=1 Tax=Glossina brevipalpis TaxID=37001 RepID=A0A1A9WXU2_9MUSC
MKKREKKMRKNKVELFTFLSSTFSSRLRKRTYGTHSCFYVETCLPLFELLSAKLRIKTAAVRIVLYNDLLNDLVKFYAFFTVTQVFLIATLQDLFTTTLQAFFENYSQELFTIIKFFKYSQKLENSLLPLTAHQFSELHSPFLPTKTGNEDQCLKDVNQGNLIISYVNPWRGNGVEDKEQLPQAKPKKKFQKNNFHVFVNHFSLFYSIIIKLIIMMVKT